jgi:hypothetical protein
VLVVFGIVLRIAAGSAPLRPYICYGCTDYATSVVDAKGITTNGA